MWIVLLSGEAFALRCGMALVSKGDRKIEVMKSCGDPDFVEKWRIKRPLPESRGFRTGNDEIVNVEEWTYNFGSSQLIQFLTFHNGRLLESKSGDYGFSPESLSPLKNSRCGKVLVLGDKKIDVLRKCGMPSSTEKMNDPETGGEVYSKEEEWTYNFGSNDFLYFIGFKNSEVVRIERGDYGF